MDAWRSRRSLGVLGGLERCHELLARQQGDLKGRFSILGVWVLGGGEGALEELQSLWRNISGIVVPL